MQDIEERTSSRDKLMAYIFGFTFVAVIVAVALVNPSPSNFAYTVFRIVLALAAAGVGAVLPGFIAVHAGTWLRAGGAVALFVVVYFFSPVAATAIDPPPPPPPAHTGKRAAELWLKSIDSGEYSRAYGAMSEYFRSQYDEVDAVSMIKRERRALGLVSTRVLDASSHAVNPPGFPKGYYVNFGYKTKFSKEPRWIYEAVQVVWEAGAWHASGFFTYVKNEQGVLVSYDPEN